MNDRFVSCVNAAFNGIEFLLAVVFGILGIPFLVLFFVIGKTVTVAIPLNDES
ncbi:MAG: hypothetical protein MUC60_11950 [Oscillatoria sp. Prado101]|jgi:hypothetical protein|nr:hypothetical protein [Oscillatoria sp. Prado101]